MEILFFVYLIIINIAGFALMGIDKKRAIRSAFRIPEASLFRIAFLGGSFGCTIGMRCFRHKTRHPKFRFGLPAICIIQICIFILFCKGILW